MTIDEIKRGETDRLEFKREIPTHDKRYLKTVVAFANGLCGSVVFGIDDKTLEVVGMPDDELRKMEDGLASAISSACTPAIVPSFSRETVEGKTLLIVDVYPGRNTPYHIKAEGLAGVYVRVGATTRRAEREQVEDLILRGGNRTYDAVIREEETGLPRIFARCAKEGVPKPQVVVGGSTVSICFQRQGKAAEEGNATVVGNVGNHVGNVGNRVGNADGNVVVADANLEQAVMDCLRGDAKISAAKMAKVAHVTTRTIERVLGRLKASGRINRKGGTRGVWEVVG